MRIHVVNTFLIGDTDHIDHFKGEGFDLFLAHFRIMQLDDFINLETGFKNRIQAGHRFLENHGDLSPADLFHLIRRSLHDVVDHFFAVEADLTFNSLSLGPLHQLHQRKRCNGLAAA